MWSSYLKTAARTLRQHKWFSAINVVGLAVSMAVCLLILAFAWDQAHYDDFHAKGDRIVRILTDQLTAQGEVEASFAASPAPLAEVLAQDVPGVEETTRLGQLRTMIIHDGNGIPAEGLFAEPSFYELFDFRLSKDTPQAILSRPGQVILTQETARKVFGEADAIGKTVQLDEQGTYTVGGIAAPPPGKTHLQFDLLVSFVSQRTTDRRDELTNWENTWNFATYLLIEDDAVVPRLQHTLDRIAERRYSDLEEPMRFRVQALEDIALGPVLGNEIASYSVPAILLYFLAVLAGLIMLAAGFNYVSLSVARALRRTKEIGVRKALGAGRMQVMGQLLGEAVLVALLATAVAGLLLVWLLPTFNSLTFVQMGDVQISLGRLLDPWLLGLFLGFSVLVGLGAGFYPALRLSRFQTASVLRDHDDVSGFSGRRLRHTLTGVQFALALFFVVSAALLFQQFRHVITADYGFEQERVMTVALQGQPFDVVANELSRQSGVQQVTATSKLPASGSTSRIMARRSEQDIETPVYQYAAGPGFVEVLGLRMVAGRSFSRTLARDSVDALVINEQAVQALGFEHAQDALGASISLDGFGEPREVIGVVEDYHYHLMVEPIEPMVLHYSPGTFRYALAQVSPGTMDAALPKATALWNELDLIHKAQVAALDAQIRDNPINRILGDATGVVGLISLLAVLISCLGLLGMALYTVETRLKEVGVRKVLGATTRHLMLLLSRDVLTIMGLASLIALPVAWLTGRMWLQAFANQIDVSPWLLIGCVLAMMGVALAVVSTQTFRAARTDPATVLRSE